MLTFIAAASGFPTSLVGQIKKERNHMAEIHASPEIIRNTLKSVVQIVALKKGFLGGMSSAWTGSGTIVDASGIILTNCHVANPRAMGMPSPPADALAIAITDQSDEPPALTYLAEIVVQSPELDIAVLKIVSDMQGRKVGRLNLPFVELGDSGQIELADEIAIFGYPGIGGETVTFTSGSVSGFTRSKSLNSRAWIKTDATIAGGNSGGTAIDSHGHLIGIPTQAAAGDGVTPVDARPVVDTNRDGRVDQRDTPMAIGGFINGLRPVNLAKPLLKQAGVKVTGAGSRSSVPSTPIEKAQQTIQRQQPAQPSSGAQIENLVFSSRVLADGRPINASEILPSGVKAIYASFQFAGFRKGTAWGQVWAHNGNKVLDQEGKWEAGGSGRQVLTLSNARGIPDGEYHLIVTVRGQVAAEGAVTVGRKVLDGDTEVGGRIVDAKRGSGINNALVIALKPNVRVMDFVKVQNKSMAFTSTRTTRDGSFTFPEQLPKGAAYSLVIVARGYKDVVVEGGLRIGATAPEKAQINPIGMQKE
jgi:S1-C subfamily serine protease